MFYLNIQFIFYIGACLSLMEAKHCPFDMDILKIVSYPKSAYPTMSLWTHWHYPSDTVSGKLGDSSTPPENWIHYYQFWAYDLADRTQCQRLLLCWGKKKLGCYRDNQGRIKLKTLYKSYWATLKIKSGCRIILQHPFKSYLLNTTHKHKPRELIQRDNIQNIGKK